jgi:hypothetical protein
MIGATPVVDVMAGVGTTLYVAATGPARPIRLNRSLNVPAGANGSLDFTGYDVPVKVAAPPGALPIATVRG